MSACNALFAKSRFPRLHFAESALFGANDNVDVGDRIHVQLIGVDVEQGFIDLNRLGS